MFYGCFSVPKRIFNLENIYKELRDRVIELPSDEFDETTHLIFILLAANQRHLSKTIQRIEENIFRKRAQSAPLNYIKTELQSLFNRLSAVVGENNPDHRRVFQLLKVVSILILRADHAFAPEHRDDCRRRVIKVSYTFPLNILRQRMVEIHQGVCDIPCGIWRVFLSEIFEHLFFIELNLVQRNREILSAVNDAEDDRLRRMVGCLRNLLGDYSDNRFGTNLSNIQRESQLFPPCMMALHQILTTTHRLSFDSRVQYTLFLKDARVSLEDNLKLWETEFSQPAMGAQCTHEWEEKKNRYVYQIKHMYGRVGSSYGKTSHSCEKFIERVSPKMNAGCPFTWPREKLSTLLKNYPTFDSEEILNLTADKEPRKACFQLLALHHSSDRLTAGTAVRMSGLQGNRFIRHGRVGGGRSCAETSPSNRCFSGSETDVSTSNENLSHEQRYVIRHTARQEPQGQENLPSSNRSSLGESTCSYNTLIIHQDEGDSKRASRIIEPGRALHDIPDDFLSESQVLKHLAKEVKTALPGDENPIAPWRAKGLRRDKLRKSKSQPDLRETDVNLAAISTSRRMRTLKDVSIVEELQQQNSKLRLELDSFVQKQSTSVKLEHELNKVHRAQEELVQSSERRGRLEREARTRLQEMNRALRDQVELLSAQVLTTRVPTGDALRRELNNRDILITQLIASNKELTACKERQDIELAAQRATLQEQRTHIDILDTALTNAQGNVVRLEEECRKKQMYVELVSQLKQALVTQQQASERREQTEQMLRLQLERELRAERGKSSASDHGSGFGSNLSGCSSNVAGSGESFADVKRKLREREEKIMMLEAENSKWEQRYIEESALRHAAIEAASLPKDAKIAALEKTSQETERLILEARSEKMRHIDEQHAAHKRVADLQARVKDLESRLAERDAMIKVLHKHTYDKGFNDLSRQQLGGSTSVFSTVSSALTSSTGFTSFSGSDPSSKLYHTSAYHPATSVSDSSKLSYHGGDTSSKLSYGGESSSKLSFSEDSYHGPTASTPMSNYGSFRGQYSAGQSFEGSKNKSLDDQLKELDSQLDSQLLSKRGLCCFPGFSNTGAPPRKGKISQPLLASVAGLGGLVRSEPPARPEEIMLLEKQGRSSQRQRAGSLPPSSLPRPRRTRKLGEYGRLSDSEAARKTSTDDAFGREDEHHQYNDYLNDPKSDDLPPASSASFSYGRLKTPPGDVRKLDYPPRPPSTPTKLDFPNYPRLKTPPLDGSLTRKRSKENSPSASSTCPNYVGFSRFKTPPLEPGKLERMSPSPNLDLTRCTPSPKLDLSRCTPPKGSVTKKSFIPPPRKLGDYSRFGRSSSDSSSATARDSGDNTQNYRIRL